MKGRSAAHVSDRNAMATMARRARPCRPGRLASAARPRVRARATPPRVLEPEETTRLQQKFDGLVEALHGSSIYLVGMMGSGKSTVGKGIAEVMGYYFFDSDSLVEQAAGGKTVSQIFAEEGEEYFRDLEVEVMSELCSFQRCVVGTGGGVVLKTRNWASMRNGVVIWLNGATSILAERAVGDGTGSRPLIANEAGEDLLATTQEKLEDIFEKRKHLYQEADACVSIQDSADSSASATPQVIVERCLDAIVYLMDKKKMELEERGKKSNMVNYNKFDDGKDTGGKKGFGG